MSSITKPAAGAVTVGPAGEINGVCPALPSSTTAYRVVAGDTSALWLLLRDAAGRAGLVGVGAYAAGVRGENLWRASIGGALGIEAFVLAYAYWQTRRAQATPQR